MSDERHLTEAEQRAMGRALRRSVTVVDGALAPLDWTNARIERAVENMERLPASQRGKLRAIVSDLGDDNRVAAKEAGHE